MAAANTMLVVLSTANALVDAAVAWIWAHLLVTATLVAQCVWIGRIRFPPIRYLTKRLDDCDILVGSHLEIHWPGSGMGVGRGNKFVLLDITEEPEAKKLTVYNTNEI